MPLHLGAQLLNVMLSRRRSDVIVEKSVPHHHDVRTRTVDHEVEFCQALPKAVNGSHGYRLTRHPTASRCAEASGI
jgi:hypothetical protein